MGQMKNVYKILVSKTEGMIPLEIYLAQDRNHWRVLVNTVMKLRVPLKAGLS
jgi:hypothetical protein